jgi:hypothetical protein
MHFLSAFFQLLKIQLSLLIKKISCFFVEFLYY